MIYMYLAKKDCIERYIHVCMLREDCMPSVGREKIKPFAEQIYSVTIHIQMDYSMINYSNLWFHIG